MLAEMIDMAVLITLSIVPLAEIHTLSSLPLPTRERIALRRGKVNASAQIKAERLSLVPAETRSPTTAGPLSRIRITDD